MAEMSFEIKNLDGRSFDVCDVVSYEWTRDADAACDGLRIRFVLNESIGEVTVVSAYYQGVCVFFGYADYQSESKNEAFIYARSSACLLVDNEAAQLTLKSPCTSVLFNMNAKPFGFKNCIENRFVGADYTVGKGTSCYGAINNFVRSFSDKNIMINPENELYIPAGGVKLAINPERVISARTIIKRGGALSRIDYKTNGEYNRHRISRALEKRGICRSRKLNLSAVEPYQKEGAPERIIAASAREYYSAELILDGVVTAELYSPVVYDGLEGYRITALKTVLSKRSEITKLTLCKKLELKEAEYVA